MSFNKWWPCPKKHTKRSQYLLPHLKELKSKLKSKRPFRYFTLCAPTMIDVFLLAREGVLEYDAERRAIDTVVFCEMDKKTVPTMVELVGREDSGFPGKLQELVLFTDDALTATFPDLATLETHLNEMAANYPWKDRIQSKIDHLELQKRFPFDFINLDFCDHYYPILPEYFMEINQTVGRMLEWQRRLVKKTKGKGYVKVDEFMMAVTCRHDSKLPPEAQTRLLNIVKSNCNKHPQYKELIEASRVDGIDAWAEKSNLDFFLAGWPKEIAALAVEKQWDMEIVECVHYSRKGSSGRPYEMVCLLCRFRRTDFNTTYLKVSMNALDSQKRVLIKSVNRENEEGKALMEDLTKIVQLRNAHAERKKQQLLPMPLEAINYFETVENVEY